MSEKTEPSPLSSSPLLMYQSEDGKTKLQILIEGETIWMTQAQIADLYQTTIPNINIHIGNILNDGELSPERTIKDYLIVQKEGNREVSRMVSHCNLEMIIAIGYRVRSHRGTQFRRWATERLILTPLIVTPHSCRRVPLICPIVSVLVTACALWQSAHSTCRVTVGDCSGK